jgi:hypothetical protein
MENIRVANCVTPRKGVGTVKLIIINVLVFLAFYGVSELTYSTYRFLLTDTAPDSFGVFEHPGETIKFDPVRGYFLTRTKSRVARVNHGKVEFTGSFYGNAQGFADSHDFSVRRSSSGEHRIAVFGDSFTSATMEPLNGPNWPDRVEDISIRDGNRRLELLNFSVDGGGLANWASVLRDIVVKDHYELDALVFAVAWDDIDRKFAMFDQIGPRKFAHARASTWDVNQQPKTRSDALSLLEKDSDPANRYVLSPPEFDDFLAGQWKPRKWRFRISERVAAIVKRWIKPPEREVSGFEPGQLELMAEIKRIAAQHSWPIMVVQIPTREDLLGQEPRINIERTRQFSELLGARFVDGREAFHGFTNQQIKNDWFPVDGHWNRGGSNQFADFMAPQLQRWVTAGSDMTVESNDDSLQRQIGHPANSVAHLISLPRR